MTNSRAKWFVVVLTTMAGVVADASHAFAATPIKIVVGPNAAALERMAADELADQFRRLFADVEPTVDTKLPQAGAADGLVVLVGNPSSNPAIRETVPTWPKLSDQGLALKSFAGKEQHGIAVGGGSPVATLWAAYELGHHFGIRYLLHGDVDPKDKVPVKFDGIDVVLEPNLPMRAWRTIDEFAIGPESWGVADQKKLLKQLAKLKFNRVVLSVYPWQPFVHYEFGGVKKQAAVLWYGEKYRIDGDTPGRSAFGKALVFENPDFAGLSSYEEMTSAGRKHAQGIIDAARDLGMTVGMSIVPLEFPREFAAALPGAISATGYKELTVRPGPEVRPDDQRLTDLVKANIRAYLDTYSGIDALYLNLPQFSEWHEHAEAAWQQLGQRHDLARFNLAGISAAANKRNFYRYGASGEQAVRASVVALACLENVLADETVLLAKDGRKVQPVISGIEPGLFGVLDRVVPKGVAVQHVVDCTAAHILDNSDVLAQVPAKTVSSSMVLTLGDDNACILPQSSLRETEGLVNELRKLKWDGFCTRYRTLAGLDPAVHYLSRAAFDPQVTARSAHDDLFVAITGNKSASDRLWLAFQHIEAATEMIDQNEIGFAFPVAGMMAKHGAQHSAPAWWAKVIEEYTQASNELYRSHDAVDLRARATIYYHAKRSEYVLDYLNAVKEVQQAAASRRNGKRDEAISHLDAAAESLYNAIDTLGDVARDQSDRGLIAVLTEHAYRPIKAKAEQMLKEAESK